MFLGTRWVKLGKDGRICFNKKISKEMDSFKISVCKEGCLILRPVKKGGSGEKIRNGRLLIPFKLREKAGLSGNLILAGCGAYLEIWPAKKWQAIIKDLISDL